MSELLFFVMLSPPRRKFRATILMLVFFLSTMSRSQTGEKVIFLNHADSLIGMEIGTEKAQKLIGHVKFTQGKTIVTCNNATRFMQSNKIELLGNVVIRQDSSTIYASRGMYYGNERIAEAFDNVRLEEGKTTLRADYGKYFIEEKIARFKTNVIVRDSTTTLTSNEFVYWREEQKSVADGNVKIVNAENRMTITGGHLENYRKLNYTKMTMHPVAVETDTAANGDIDTMMIMSNVMESYQDSLTRLVATDSVFVTRSDGATSAGTAIFFTKLDSIVLQRNPVVWYTHSAWETTQVSGDSIFIKLNKRNLERLHVRGHAFAISRADSVFTHRYHQMNGQEVTMYFNEKSIRRIDVEKTATVMYYIFDGKKPNGANKTSGDHVAVTFAQKKIGKIKVTSGVEGQYFPEKMIKKKETEYNLPGFNWQTPHKHTTTSRSMLESFEHSSANK